MSKNSNKYEKKGFGIVEIPRFSDPRGSLSFAEWRHLPFDVQRVFWIYDVKEGMTRGGHAHCECAEVVFAVSGSFDMFVDNGEETAVFHIDDPSKGIYIGKSVWCELRNFAPGTVCVVVASVPYMKDGYINDYEEFKKKNAL